MRPIDRELEAAASVLAGRALLRRTVEALAPHGIVPLVLKGALVSALAEGSAEPPRRMIDVDVLVPAPERGVAERVLIAAGLIEVARTPAATTLRDPSLRLDLDLHSALIEPGLFAIDERALLARASFDRALFGVAVRVPHEHDLYAHLVAHFARNRSGPGDARRIRDFAIVAGARPMRAPAVADHLHALGLARAARYALGLAARAGDGFAAEVLSAMPPDPIGEALARGAEVWLERIPGSSVLAIPALHALNRSLPRAARSLAMHVARGARSRTRRMLERLLVPR